MGWGSQFWEVSLGYETRKHIKPDQQKHKNIDNWISWKFLRVKKKKLHFEMHSDTASPPLFLLRWNLSHFIALAGLELTLQIQVGLQLRDHLPLPPSAGIKSMHHNAWPVTALSVSRLTYRLHKTIQEISSQIKKAKLPVDCWPISGELSSLPLTAIMLTTYSVPGLRSVMVKEFREGGIRSCLGLPTACSAW